MIELIVFDIDGVITDGSVIIDSNGREQKQINLKDIDAIFELHRRGYKLAAIMPGWDYARQMLLIKLKMQRILYYKMKAARAVYGK